MTEKRSGALIVLDGTDGSGKTTQTTLLIDRLRSDGLLVEMADFPQYDKPTGMVVSQYLRGDFGTPEEVGPYAGSIPYAMDRYAKSGEMKEWLANGRVVVCNRYMSANKGHQTGKLRKDKTKDNPLGVLDTQAADEFLKWLEDLEFGVFRIPKPDKTLLLHMPWHIGKRLADERARGVKDAHEADPNHLRAAEEAYLYVAKKERWNIIKCNVGEEPDTRENIHQRVYAPVKELLVTKGLLAA